MYQLSRTQSDSEDNASPPQTPTPAPALRRSTQNSQPQQQYDASTGNWKAFITKPANISVQQALQCERRAVVLATMFSFSPAPCLYIAYMSGSVKWQMAAVTRDFIVLYAAVS
ncbi:hypothetical protein BCR33DRAFT_797098 [Rhizoclosmatium globosum]|uniref:Uncharacterized protein n=1 Tax=Rhizoclosmatium globosum TaxID=329046 RepID=A0A1Y2AJW5_9FUNG|nr:hypothetical protein BCR33DRAFT_797098 [Rhizoclosmatium globosum]|eukprot:ORY22517.1 hypothetical protein BCR33DRAFT_797098 [Rhizoclosmatium globosum]